MDWVLLNKYCDLTGETRDSFNSKRRRGLIAHGIHYTKPCDGRIWVNLREMEKWVENEKSSL